MRWFKPHDGFTPKSNVFICSNCGNKVYSMYRKPNSKETVCIYPSCPYCKEDKDDENAICLVKSLYFDISEKTMKCYE